MSEIKDTFLSRLQQSFPELTRERMGPLVSDFLLSPFSIELPSRALLQAQDFVRTCFQIRESSRYLQLLQPQLHELELIDPRNKSILMSYDFHLMADGSLKLVEINTNASFLALGHWMYQAHGLRQPIETFQISEIADNIHEELKLFGQPKKNPTYAIVDDQPSSQRLYAEFLLFEQLFNSWGFQGQIADLQSIPDKVDFIYNRSTDFFLSEPKSADLKHRYLNKTACLSPHPFEYFLLADKQRIIDLSDPQFLEQLALTQDQAAILKQGLGSSFELNPTSAEKAWADRKKLFFKPKRSFGAKQSFKGASISRRAFDEMANGDFIAQEYLPADEKEFLTPTGSQSFKYDLRFYAYQDRVQSVVARLYQGQVTNLRTPLGGFAPVKFT